ncbi:MAG: hypothetical protein IPL86_19235 [Flavobacteriales bacterium]|nr:hypothetical protein [Flavobacteriales bacterium]
MSIDHTKLSAILGSDQTTEDTTSAAKIANYLYARLRQSSGRYERNDIAALPNGYHAVSGLTVQFTTRIHLSEDLSSLATMTASAELTVEILWTQTPEFVCEFRFANAKFLNSNQIPCETFASRKAKNEFSQQIFSFAQSTNEGIHKWLAIGSNWNAQLQTNLKLWLWRRF